jgi:5-methylcytosine-specific restriction protein A
MREQPWNRPWREWYQLERWRRRRRLQLKAHPVCAMCAARGLVTTATIADHVVPHHGDWNTFLLGDLQSLCKPCHDRDKRNEKERGWTPEVDADGWPIDPRHPANRGANAY